LKLLQETYLGKVKMIYIDPPYNTGNDFIYEDDFAENSESYKLRSNQKDEEGNRLVANNESNGRFHSDWLSMIYPRLKLARNLLRDDGVIFISIDDGEAANLKRICDEVFGEENFLASIAWEKRYTRSNNAKRFYSLKDSIICYRKSGSLEYVKEARNEKSDSNYSNPDNDPRGEWTTSSYVNPATKEKRPNLVYEINRPFDNFSVVHETHAWKYSFSEHQRHIDDNKLWWGKDRTAQYPRLKLFLSEQTGGLVPIDLWGYKDAGTTDEGGAELKTLFGSAIFDNPKPSKLILKMLSIASNIDKKDIILDFFSGSATTAHAVMQLNAEDDGNRKFIMVQLPEYCDEKSEAYKSGYKNIAEIGKERIRRAGQKIKQDNADKPGINQLDIGFRVLKVDSSNMNEVYYTPDAINQNDLFNLVDNVRADRTEEDLLFQVLLDWGVDLTLPITQETFYTKDKGGRMKDDVASENSSFSPQPSSLPLTVFFVDGNVLAACFDKHGGITEDFVKQLATRSPLRVVFRDAGFANDSVKINIEQIFKLLSPTTEIKTL